MLKRLTEVQEFDLAIDGLEAERAQVPSELTELAERVRSLEARTARKDLEVAELRRKVEANEQELKAMSERRRSASDSALRAASAKEASQYQNQELQMAARAQELEEDTLPLMQALEDAGADFSALREELDGLLPALAEMQQAEVERVEKLDARIADTRRQRDALAVSVEAPLLKQYEQVRRSRKGLGVVQIVDNAKCGGCNVKLPLHVVQKVRSGAGITRCSNCGRILMPPPAPEA